MAQQAKLDSLKESLKAADEQILHQKSLNSTLELENQKLNAFTKHLLQKLDMSQREMVDVREQCNEITKEASAAKTITAEVSSKSRQFYYIETDAKKKVDWPKIRLFIKNPQF